MFGILSFLKELNDIENRLIEKIKTFPIQQTEDPAARIETAGEVLKELLEGKNAENPAVPKVMLFELMLIALCNGSISSVQMALLKQFQSHHQLEDFIFDDLLECAKTLTQETSKTISIILE